MIIDLQNDFCPGGALAVPDGDRILPVVNRLTFCFDLVVQTQDWHPAGHLSFATSWPDHKPFETVKADYGEQILWPDHCVQGSEGARFHSGLETNSTILTIRKGFRQEIDSYSAFFENDGKTRTGLEGALRELDTTKLTICGLATDFCVKWSVIDALEVGFEVDVVDDAVSGIDLDGSVDIAWEEMLRAGANKVYSSELI